MHGRYEGQRAVLRAALLRGASLNCHVARMPPYNCLRLAARIHEIRAEGLPVRTTRDPETKIAVYDIPAEHRATK